LTVGAALAAAVVRLSTQSAQLRETRAGLQAEREDNQRKELELSRIKARLISKTKLLEEKSKAMPWIAEMVADIRWVHDGKRIYHLPMDQQYDRVKLVKPGEFYAATVAEAEAKASGAPSAGLATRAVDVLLCAPDRTL
jgi:hypothetical protein